MTKPEAQTRSELIDKRLAEAGWNVQDPTQVAEEFVITKSAISGVAEPRIPYECNEFSDYALLTTNQIGGYLQTLSDRYRLIESKLPIFAKPTARRRRYYLSDNFLESWLAAIAPSVAASFAGRVTGYSRTAS